jgi:hypothetical protein
MPLIGIRDIYTSDKMGALLTEKGENMQLTSRLAGPHLAGFVGSDVSPDVTLESVEEAEEHANDTITMADTMSRVSPLSPAEQLWDSFREHWRTLGKRVEKDKVLKMDAFRGKWKADEWDGLSLASFAGTSLGQAGASSQTTAATAPRSWEGSPPWSCLSIAPPRLRYICLVSERFSRHFPSPRSQRSADRSLIAATVSRVTTRRVLAFVFAPGFYGNTD